MPNHRVGTPAFVDLFAGCGGLSLGLAQAGWRGTFAIERDQMAFATFSKNFLQGPNSVRFDWPVWLERRAWPIDSLLSEHASELRSMRGRVQLLAGGPPCQGFSFAGRRVKADPRNQLFTRYVQMVDLLRPDALVVENVPGMRVAHGSNQRRGLLLPGPQPKSYYHKLVDSLKELDYVASGCIIDASHFGVPQQRPRLIVIGLAREIADGLQGGVARAFQHVEWCRLEQLAELGLSQEVTARDAISDLEVSGRTLRSCDDPASPKGFFELKYEKPRTTYQRLMHENLDVSKMNSMRLARHTKLVSERFRQIIDSCRQGVRMSDEDRDRFGLLKHRVYPMSPHKPAPTITTLPDDVVHYCDPRILTVRESARLQSFPDWFEFCGKFTTGGNRRTKECPRYTQVGNAVPPLLARAIGAGICAALAECKKMQKSETIVRPRRQAVVSA
jgi:DNA (cytosine-5)-methyltransferase 1